MTTPEVQRIYQQYIKPLSPTARLQLVEQIIQDMREQSENDQDMISKEHSIMELHGLGAEIWEGIDAQEYINEMRNEWDRRP